MRTLNTATRARLVRFVATALTAALLSSCASLFPWGRDEDYVKVDGTRFLAGSAPYYFTGTNLWYGFYLGSPGPTGNRDRLCRELDRLQELGITNLRVLAGSEASYMPRAVVPPLQQAPGVLDESLLAGLDVLLAEMAERDMRAVLYLNNYWEWSGGMVQYNVWADGGPGVNPEDPALGWPAFMNFAASFYANARANALYREFIRGLVSRTNTVNGREYAADPTIMAWQLANEPRPGALGPEGEGNIDAYVAWIDSTAAFIHSLDSVHLVSSGSEGVTGSLLQPEVFLRSHRTQQIDYLTFHLWPFNWGWYDPKRGAETYAEAMERSLAYLRQHLALARELGKPIVLEEFGLHRDGGLISPAAQTTWRDQFYRAILTAVADSARAGAPIAGTNFWAWGGEGRGKNEDGMWRRGDPFVGDPPQEPQGMYTVFDTDTSTGALLREMAKRISRIGLEDTILASKAAD
jgi:mannan endo-1,4-beta-mannosidase